MVIKINKSKIERKLDFLEGRRSLLNFGIDKYVQNYHHSMIWVITLMSILIALGIEKYMITGAILSAFVLVYRLVTLGWVTLNYAKVDKKIDEEILLIYKKFGVDVEEINKKIGGINQDGKLLFRH